MKPFRKILLVLLSALLLAVVGFAIWAATPLRASPEALSALQSDSTVTVTEERFITFSPANQRPAGVGLIFYPGGHVEARAYARPMRQIAAQGYLVVLVPVRLNLAFFDINAAAPVLSAHPEIEHWVLAGHSLGGVAAAMFAGSHSQISGLVFWASYPPDSTLKDSDLRVLSIYGTNDMAGVEKFHKSRLLLPENAHFVPIPGGNHSQFGDYGLQPGDKPAEISRLDQQSQAVQAVVQFLASFIK
jgi:hypothetical protein